MLYTESDSLYEVRTETGKLLMQIESSEDGYVLLIKPHGVPETYQIVLKDLIFRLHTIEKA